jgi:hypothetical protein
MAPKQCFEGEQDRPLIIDDEYASILSGHGVVTSSA